MTMAVSLAWSAASVLPVLAALAAPTAVAETGPQRPLNVAAGAATTTPKLARQLGVSTPALLGAYRPNQAAQAMAAQLAGTGLVVRSQGGSMLIAPDGAARSHGPARHALRHRRVVALAVKREIRRQPARLPHLGMEWPGLYGAFGRRG